MRLERLQLRDFRCFESADLEFDPSLTWIVGPNASGKTSLLEAIYFLGHGRSFRSSRPDRLIRESQAAFELVARLNDGGPSRVLGLRRDGNGTEARFAGEPLKSMAEAARLLPAVVLDSSMHELVAGGPSERRRWLDWGVFHVEHRFFETWRNYRSALRQRNEGLKAGAAERVLQPWTLAVVRYGEQLAESRRQFFGSFVPILRAHVEAALPGVPVEFSLRQGWAEGEGYAEALARHLGRDRELGVTRYGPHRADVVFKVEGLPAEERLSRGQQKMLSGALWLAQVQMLNRGVGTRPLLLADDLASELDGTNLARFLEMLAEVDAQKVLTAISDSDVARTGLTQGRVFHVEHGRILRQGTFQ